MHYIVYHFIDVIPQATAARRRAPPVWSDGTHERSARNPRRRRYTVVQCTPRSRPARTACSRSRESGSRPNGRSTGATFSTRLLLSFASAIGAPQEILSSVISKIKGHTERLPEFTFAPSIVALQSCRSQRNSASGKNTASGRGQNQHDSNAIKSHNLSGSSFRDECSQRHDERPVQNFGERRKSRPTPPATRINTTARKVTEWQGASQRRSETMSRSCRSPTPRPRHTIWRRHLSTSTIIISIAH